MKILFSMWVIFMFLCKLHGPTLPVHREVKPFWKLYLREKALEAGLDYRVLIAQVYTESNGKNYVIERNSRGRAISFWMCQISIATAVTYSRDTGVNIGRNRYQIIRWLKNKKNSIDVLVWSMKRYYDVYGDYRKALTCYNAGHRGYIRHYKYKLGYRKEYVDRVSKFLGHKLTY